MIALLLPLRMASASCGDGVLDLGELCDAGPDPTGTCCTALCTFALPGTTCRPAAGDCDLPETCDGLSAACPTNVFRPAEECRPAVGPCDVAEHCSGVGPACPVDSFAPPSVVCRPSTSVCDVAETCTGSSAECPADTGTPDTDGDGVCDAIDLCPQTPDPLQLDGDGDGIGDACDPCNNVEQSTLQNPRLAFSKLGGAADDDRVKLKANFFVPNDPPIDPLHKGLRLIVGGPLGVVFDTTLPPGKFDASSRIGWQAADNGARWLYVNGSGVLSDQAGIRRVLLRADHAGGSQLRITVAGRGGSLSVAAGQPSLTVTVIVDAPLATTGQCSEATFITTGNGSQCRLLNGGHRLECRQGP